MSRLEGKLTAGDFVVTAEMPTIDGGGFPEIQRQLAPMKAWVDAVNATDNPAAQQVAPRRRALQAVVDRRAQVVDVRAPDRQLLGPRVGLDPHAAHLGLDLAVAVRPHAAAGAVAQRLGTRHRTGEAGVVQDALPAHPAVPDGSLDRVLDGLEQAHAGTRERRSWMSALAFFTAEDASAE